MSNFLKKFTGKMSHKKTKSQGDGGEQTFTIQPHPAKTNDPADLPKSTASQAVHGRDPHVPSQEVINNLEQPATREELRARAAELNK